VQADANTLANDWFSPGDIGSVHADGILCIEGRTTDVVNQGGKKISTAVVEDIVVKFLGEPVMVSAVGVALPQGFEQIVIVIDEKFSARIPALSAHLKKLSIFRRGVRIFALKEFPLNAAGKIDKKELRAAIARGKLKQV
jgi:non-ribosomal peptide synthetase component E (peptide arylation enzyme)